ncbi:MAG: hydrogenase maturation nickel metallochaperone HypA [Candidatus Electrothrix sp. AUS4]|nr:hydrogenase maturation nickel metallochaperone HypA [Candidatus Electrothrix sp. AUS4]
MHELAVTQSILDIVLQHAKGRKIQQVNLVIGQFSSIVDDSVQFYWEIIAKETLAAEAKLHFERIPGEMTCASCDHVFHPDSETFLCPTCASNAVRVSGGREFQVDSIEVE